MAKISKLPLKIKVTPPAPRVLYKLKHPLVGEIHPFDSWSTLCEFVMDIAADEAKRRLNGPLLALIEEIADEIVATAEEYGSECSN